MGSRNDINLKLQQPLLKLADDLAPGPQNRLLTAAGMEAKDIAEDEVIRDLGADMRMSGVRSKARLSSGFDVEGPDVLMKLRPKGLWNLATFGRKNKKVRSLRIYASKAPNRPGRQGRKSDAVALKTPYGYRYSVKRSTTPGHGTTKRVDDRWNSGELAEAMSLELGRIISQI